MMEFTIVRTFLTVVFCWGTMGWIFSQECNILHHGIDLQTKSFKTEIAPGHLFNFSPPELKNDLQQDNLMNCRGQFVQIDNEKSLNLNIQLNSLLAQERYGTIERDFILKITFLNGKDVELKCIAGSKGVLSNKGKAYVYPVAYSVTGRVAKSLSKNLVDKIGIQWSSGYEEYAIYEVDFFTNQLQCLNQTLQKPN